MLAFLQGSGRASDRKLRLFAVACCRRVWQLMPDERSQEAVEAAEQFADGIVDEEELDQANNRLTYDPTTTEVAAFLTSVRRYGWPSILFRYGIVDLNHLDEEAERRLESICSAGFHFPAEVAVVVARKALGPNPRAEAWSQATLLRDLFNPFYLPSRTSPSLRAWNNGLVQHLAEEAYQERELPSGHLDTTRLLILADTLEDAGCTDPLLLEHLRGSGPHVRGCSVVDLLSGRK
jgi:hypothetical protein